MNIDNEIVFIITLHISNFNHRKYWRNCYRSIRKFYPTVLIILINDKSKLKDNFDEIDSNTKLIISNTGQAEILPYVYYYQYQWKPKMIYLHDTMELNRKFTIEELSHEIIPHWHFSSHKHDNKELINKFINILNIQSLDLNWNGCFGATCIISLTKIIELENKYNIWSKLPKYIKNRLDRMAFERILGILIFINSDIKSDIKSNFGDIINYPNAFKLNKEEFNLTNSSSSASSSANANANSSAIIKYWIGR